MGVVPQPVFQAMIDDPDDYRPSSLIPAPGTEEAPPQATTYDFATEAVTVRGPTRLPGLSIRPA